MTKHVAIYCRLSPRPDGSYEGVDAQESWGRDYASSAWPGLPVEVFRDKGISASNGDHRPEFERFRQWLGEGRIAHVWTVEQTRLERREVQWFQLAAELDAAGISEVHTNRDGVVRVRDDVAGIKAVLAAGEIRKLKSRINDRLTEIAADGQPPGSKPFGYEHGRNENGVRTYVIIPEQAEAIQQAAEWVLAGWSLTNIARELRKRGLRGAHGGELRNGNVRNFLTKPTTAGYRVHQGRIIGRGNWPAILDEETWQACKLKLSQPRTVQRVDGGIYPISLAHKGNPAGRRYLLTGGLAVCGVCEAPLYAAVHYGQQKPYYVCHKKMRRPNGEPAGSCVGIMGLELEQHVVAELFDELDKPEFLDMLAADQHVQQRDRITKALRDIEGQRNDLAALWATPNELTSAEWQTARRALAEREQELRRDLAELPPPVVNVDISRAREAWPLMTLDEQREFIRMFISTVTVKRAKPGTKGFDGGRVDIDWRTA